MPCPRDEHHAIIALTMRLQVVHLRPPSAYQPYVLRDAPPAPHRDRIISKCRSSDRRLLHHRTTVTPLPFRSAKAVPLGSSSSCSRDSCSSRSSSCPAFSTRSSTTSS